MIRYVIRKCHSRETGRRGTLRKKHLRPELLEHRVLLTTGLAFDGPLPWSAGEEPSAIVTADLNGDEHLDIIVADRHSSDVGVWLSVADGTFAQPVQFGAGRPAKDMTIADFDGDGGDDVIIVGGEGSHAGVSVMRSIGAGGDPWRGLEMVANIGTSDLPTSTVVEDFDADGHVDLVVADSVGVSVRMGRGNGTFSDAIGFLPGVGLRALAAADFNGDQVLDLAVSNGVSTQVSILLGIGDGTFEPHDQTYAVGASGQGRKPWPVTVDDFNADEKPDLAIAHDYAFEGNVSILYGRGDGSFETEAGAYTIIGTPTSIADGDIDNDGDQDLVVGHGGVLHFPGYGDVSGGVSVLQANGDGTFESPIRLMADVGTRAVHLAEINGDERLDILTDGQSPVLMLRGREGATFENELTTLLAGSDPSWASAGDLNDDGNVDLIVSNRESNDVSILFGDGGGQDTQPVRHEVGTNPGASVVADLNADGRLDLAVTNLISNDVSILIGTQDSGFHHQVRYTVGQSPKSLAAVDFNGDKVLDLVVANQDSNNLSVLIGQGDGTFAKQYHVGVGEAPQSVISADLDFDGHLDLVVLHQWPGDVSVLLGHGDGTFDPMAKYAVGEDALSVALADIDVDGHLDVAVIHAYQKTILVMPGAAGGTFDIDAKSTLDVADYPSSLTVADVNSDQIPDLITGNGEINKACRDICLGGGVSVLIGQGDGTFEPAENYFYPNADFRTVTAWDLEGDGDQDLLLVNAHGTNAIRNVTPQQFTPQAGDSNSDREFDQTDLVLVLQANKYKTGRVASFSEGDWNGDGVFDQLDIVSALQTGNYLQGPYAARPAQRNRSK